MTVRLWTWRLGVVGSCLIPLTNTEFSLFYISQTNEVNQGDALEHNFSAIHAALLLPVTHLLHGTPLQQVSGVPTWRHIPLESAFPVWLPTSILSRPPRSRCSALGPNCTRCLPAAPRWWSQPRRTSAARSCASRCPPRWTEWTWRSVDEMTSTVYLSVEFHVRQPSCLKPAFFSPGWYDTMTPEHCTCPVYCIQSCSFATYSY